MLPLTDSNLVVARYLFDKVDTNKGELGFEVVYYGDQTKLPATPALTVEPGPKERSLTGTSRTTEVLITTYMLVYVARVADNQENKKDADELSERVELFVHEDPQLGGNVIHCMVTSIEPGYASRGALMRASRITVQSKSKVRLPNA